VDPKLREKTSNVTSSSTFENKVPDDVVHSRFKTIRTQVDKLLKAREKKRK
jgi:hypothetical protein